MSSVLSLWRQIFEERNLIQYGQTMEKTSVPLAWQKRQLNQGDPSDETAKTQVSCNINYCMIPYSPSSQATRVEHRPNFSLFKVSFPYETFWKGLIKRINPPWTCSSPSSSSMEISWLTIWESCRVRSSTTDRIPYNYAPIHFIAQCIIEDRSHSE